MLAARLSVAAISLSLALAQNPSASVTIDVNANRHPINPNIYGVAYGDTASLNDLNCPLNRQGGNATTRYNWQINAANRAADYYFESIGEPSSVAGEFGDTFIANSKTAGAQAMLTIPMIGWLAKLGPSRSKLASFSVLKYGLQQFTDPYFTDAGNGVVKGTGQNITGNDPNDANVLKDSTYQQQWVQHLTATWGTAQNGGLRYYLLDNEPSIWQQSHRDVRPTGVLMADMRDTIIDFAGKIRGADATATILGPEEWGWSGYIYSGYDQQYGSQHGYTSWPDRAAHGNQDYLPWLLSQLKQTTTTTGVKYLDVFSVHYYPQGNEFPGDGTTSTQLKRNRSTRSLWDPNYVDESWINDKVMLIPRLKNWVNTYYYPGTPVAITEYNWGAESEIGGATAQADILGIFGREALDMGVRWTSPDPSTPTYKAIKMYRNYDGAKSTFGDISVLATVANPDNVSAFAAQRSSDNALTIVVINKYLTGNTPVTLNVSNFAGAVSAKTWQLTSANAITPLPDVAVSGGALSATLPPLSITLFVIPQTQAPTSDSVSPNAGSVAAQSFTFKYSSVNGFSYLNDVYAMFNGSVNGAGACFAVYDKPSNAFYLYNDTGAGISAPLAPGSGASVSNSQCTLNGTGSSVSGSGNTLTMVLNLSLNPALGGSQNIYMDAIDGGGMTSGWQVRGTWTVPSTPTPPTVDSVAPASGGGLSQSFTFKYSSVNGSAYLKDVYALFNTAVNGGGACFVVYDKPSGGFYLYNDAGNGVSGPLAPGAGTNLSNGQCTLSGAGSSVSGAGNTLTMILNLAFNTTFGGAQNTYMYASDNGGLSSGWVNRGSWSVPVIPTAPTADSASPASGGAATQIFTLKYSSVNGFGYLSDAYVLFRNAVNGANACFVVYDKAANGFYLYNDAGSALTGPLPQGSGGSLSNTQCTLNGTGSSASGSLNTVTVILNLTFNHSFAGTQTTWMYAYDKSGLASGWINRGTWTVP